MRCQECLILGEDTVYRWLRRAKNGNLAPKKREDFPRKMDTEKLLEYVYQHPDHTLVEIGGSLGMAHQTASKWLRRLGITRKKTTLYQERNEEKRAEFKKQLALLDPETLVYVDEAGVDNRLFREYGRALKGPKSWLIFQEAKERA